jgi:prepilin-type N-terminal cleavage/methylation domain-containing protein
MNNKGFTIIETMFAISIFAMGLMAAVQLHYSTARNNTNGNIISMAHMAAKAELEGLRGKDILDLEEGVYSKQVGIVLLETTITKDPHTIRLGRAVIVAKVRNKTIRYETLLNNMWGKDSNKHAIF